MGFLRAIYAALGRMKNGGRSMPAVPGEEAMARKARHDAEAAAMVAAYRLIR